MTFTFDHLVHFVDEPREAIELIKEKGIHAVEGGAHVKHGTYNTLTYFDLSYIEFLGTSDRKLVEETEHPKHSLVETVVNDGFSEGFSRFAARTSDIEGVAKHFREKGLTVNGPVPFTRKRPDGSEITWKLLYAGDESNDLQLPFIIQWDESDEERRATQIEKGVIAPHQAGDISFSHVTFAVKDAKKTAEKWADLLQLNIVKEYVDDELNATCQVLELQGGNLVFASPNGDGVVRDVLEKRGEKPFQVTLTSASNEQTFELLGGTYHISKK
ncbi:VOC family protein [bacterium LRH843]|nr:VOC family protein [bacterium LRH843]